MTNPSASLQRSFNIGLELFAAENDVKKSPLPEQVEKIAAYLIENSPYKTEDCDRSTCKGEERCNFRHPNNPKFQVTTQSSVARTKGPRKELPENKSQSSSSAHFANPYEHTEEEPTDPISSKTDKWEVNVSKMPYRLDSFPNSLLPFSSVPVVQQLNNPEEDLSPRTRAFPSLPNGFQYVDQFNSDLYLGASLIDALGIDPKTPFLPPIANNEPNKLSNEEAVRVNSPTFNDDEKSIVELPELPDFFAGTESKFEALGGLDDEVLFQQHAAPREMPPRAQSAAELTSQTPQRVERLRQKYLVKTPRPEIDSKPTDWKTTQCENGSNCKSADTCKHAHSLGELLEWRNRELTILSPTFLKGRGNRKPRFAAQIR